MVWAVSHSKQFLSTPSARRATTPSTDATLSALFLSTPSARRATRPHRRPGTSTRHFYPRPPRGGRLFRRRFTCSGREYFYPRPPRGGRPQEIGVTPDTMKFLSTPSARRATRPVQGCTLQAGISIHALREEGDHRKPLRGVLCIQFLSTPSARRATCAARAFNSTLLFLSTPSARRATSDVVLPSLSS